MTIEIQDKTDLEITSELLAEVPDTYQKNAGYFIWDFLMAIGKILAVFWANLQYLCNFFDITKLDYDDLVLFVYQRRGIVAKTETYATGKIKITSTGSVSIVKDDIFETADGMQFKALETVTLTNSQTFNAQCVTAGAVGNVPVGTITVIPITKTNLVSITNDEAFSGGYDKETKESIIERYLEDLRNPITSGNVYHYLKWAKEVTGVGNAKIKPLWNGDNTVKVIICDSNNSTASQTLVDAVQEYIDPYELIEGVKVGWGCGNGQAPIGAYCTVASGTALTINVSAEIELMSGYTLADATANIEAKIEEYLKSTVFKDSYVSYAKIGAKILEADGVKDYDNLLVNNDNDNVAIVETSSSCEIAVKGTITITEISD